MTKGTCVYDADCGFCTRCAHWLDRRGTCEIVPWQSLDLDAVGLSEDAVTTAVQWLDGSGRPVASGAGAIAAALRTGGPILRLAGRVIDARPMRPARIGCTKGSPATAMRCPAAPTPAGST